MGGHHDPESVNLAAASWAQAPAHDPLSDVLRMVQLTGALFFLMEASSPWGVEVPTAAAFAPIILPRARHIISYHIVTEGQGWASVAGSPGVRFSAGDILVFPRGHAYAMLSTPDGRVEA